MKLPFIALHQPRLILLLIGAYLVVGAYMISPVQAQNDQSKAYTFLFSDGYTFNFPMDWDVTWVSSRASSATVSNLSQLAIDFNSVGALEVARDTNRSDQALEDLAKSLAASEGVSWELSGREIYELEDKTVKRADFDQISGLLKISIFVVRFNSGKAAFATAYFNDGKRDDIEIVISIIKSLQDSSTDLTTLVNQSDVYVARLQQYVHKSRLNDIAFTYKFATNIRQRPGDDVVIMSDDAAAATQAVLKSGSIVPIDKTPLAYMWTISHAEVIQIIKQVPVDKVKEIFKNTCLFSCESYTELANQFEETGEPVHPAIVALGLMRQLNFGYERTDLEWAVCMTCVGTRINLDNQGGVWVNELPNSHYIVSVYYGNVDIFSSLNTNLSWAIATANDSSIPNYTQEQRQLLGLPIITLESTIHLEPVSLSNKHEVSNHNNLHPSYTFQYPDKWYVTEETFNATLLESLTSQDIVPTFLTTGETDLSCQARQPSAFSPTILCNAIAIYGPEINLLPLWQTMLYTLELMGLVRDVTAYEYDNQYILVYEMRHPLVGATGLIAAKDGGSSGVVLVGPEDAKSLGVEMIVAIAASIKDGSNAAPTPVTDQPQEATIDLDTSYVDYMLAIDKQLIQGLATFIEQASALDQKAVLIEDTEWLQRTVDAITEISVASEKVLQTASVPTGYKDYHVRYLESAQQYKQFVNSYMAGLDKRDP